MHIRATVDIGRITRRKEQHSLSDLFRLAHRSEEPEGNPERLASVAFSALEDLVARAAQLKQRLRQLEQKPPGL
jgi:hypothetical protein